MYFSPSRRLVSGSPGSTMLVSNGGSPNSNSRRGRCALPVPRTVLRICLLRHFHDIRSSRIVMSFLTSVLHFGEDCPRLGNGKVALFNIVDVVCGHQPLKRLIQFRRSSYQPGVCVPLGAVGLVALAALVFSMACN